MSLGRLADAVLSLVELVLEQRIDYYAMHPATVVHQRPDGSLDVRPDHPKLKDLNNVPIDIGHPGTSFKVKAGSRVLVGFRRGDARERYAMLTSGTQVESAEFKASESITWAAPKVDLDGTSKARPIARMADLVAIGGGLLAYPPPLAAPCVFHLLTPLNPMAAPVPFAALPLNAMIPPPPMLTPGMSILGAIQFGPKPLVGAITTAKNTHKT